MSTNDETEELREHYKAKLAEKTAAHKRLRAKLNEKIQENSANMLKINNLELEKEELENGLDDIKRFGVKNESKVRFKRNTDDVKSGSSDYSDNDDDAKKKTQKTNKI
eukprot:TRINITY_DN14219_c0_g1_i1.p1 TRINITY_DN14219_c0_g1~~TRINITY_DN14219_c0_g1_i1.p1  ORF type:complete len:108 (-),score=20.16 TRINITY_DN14219_c0_g1_i1:49-372(-)